MSKLLMATHFINGFLLIRFALSKLFAWPISVAAFVEMAKPIGIDPTFFRLFTGVLITVICLGYFTDFFLIIAGKVNKTFMKYTNLLGMGVMVGALGAEFFLRVEPKWPLVFIAGLIITLSAINLLRMNQIQSSKFYA